MKSLFKLMDVKTLVAGAIPVVFASVFSLYRYGTVSLFDMLILLVGILLLQSCANMINDLFDHKRGADGDARVDEKALASGEVSSAEVTTIVGIFLIIDILIAIYYSVSRHWGIMIVGLCGALVMYFYSAGKWPISYTPFGEVVAGSTMGFGIMTTVIFIQSGNLSFETFIVAIPTSIYIGTILLTNNISDHKEDQAAGRYTLPILIGVKNSEILWITNCCVMLLISAILVIIDCLPIESIVLALILMPYKSIIAFRNIKKVPSNKGRMMGLIGTIGLRFHLALITGILIAVFIRPIL